MLTVTKSAQSKGVTRYMIDWRAEYESINDMPFHSERFETSEDARKWLIRNIDVIQDFSIYQVSYTEILPSQL